jgi:hypothetical protein
LGGENDPSLMLGEAGIGLFYLRLFSDQVGSALLPVPCGPSCRTPVVNEDYKAAAEKYVHAYFKQAFYNPRINLWPLQNRPREPERPVSQVDNAFQELGNLSTSGRLSEEEQTQFALESIAYRLAKAGPNWPNRLVAKTIGVPREIPGHWRLKLSPHGVLLVRTTPSEAPATKAHLVTVTAAGVEMSEISGLCAIVLSSASQPIEFEAIVDIVQGFGLDRPKAVQVTNSQVFHALLAGVLVRDYPPDATRDSA